jgi:hypothetical protein
MYPARKIISHAFQGVLLAAGLLTGAGCHASTVISELFYDAAGADNGLVFVELFGTPGTHLDGMLLEGVNGSDGAVYRSISLSGVIPADGVFVIADDRVADVDFQNGPDAIVLRNAAGVLDALGYGDFTAAHFAGEGSAAVDVNAGRSLVRLDPLLDSDDNAVDFSVQETPTPGSLPVAAVPVPPAFFLFMSGIAGLVGIGRRKRLAAANNSV